MSHRYTMKYRPAGISTAPPGWRYAASGTYDTLPLRPDLPRSPYRYGVIEYDRALTPAELETFEMVSVETEVHR